jgi:hypothetical protein
LRTASIIRAHAIGPLPHLIVTHSSLVSPSFTWTADSYITCNPFAHGLFIALMMEAVGTSETSVDSNEPTRRYIPEYSKLHTRRHDDLKSQLL